MSRKLYALLMLCSVICITLPSFASENPETFFQDNMTMLTHEKIIFHWTTKTKVQERTKSKKLNNNIVQSYLKKTVNYEIKTSLWNGLYFATNPVISHRFGLNSKFPSMNDNHWVLVSLRLKEGTKFLDVSDSTSTPLSGAEQKWFRKYGCLAKETKELGIENVGNSKQCATALYKFLEKVNAVGILYEWWDFDQDFCPLHQEENYKSRAMVIKNTLALERERMNYFTANSHEQDDTNFSILHFIEELWRTPFELTDINSIAVLRRSKLWDIELSTPVPFNNNHLVDCNARD